MIETSEKSSILRLVIFSWISILIFNLAALVLIYTTLKNNLAAPSQINLQEEKTEEVDCGLVCNENCHDYVDLAVATLAANPKNTTNYTPQNSKKETYIPLGSVTQKSPGSWSDTGLQTYLDPADWGGNPNLQLEVSLQIPTANGQARLRLWQANENFLLPGTEIIGEGNKPVLVTSKPFKLDKGNKLYKLQLYTTMDYETVIDSARIKVTY